MSMRGWQHLVALRRRSKLRVDRRRQSDRRRLATSPQSAARIRGKVEATGHLSWPPVDRAGLQRTRHFLLFLGDQIARNLTKYASLLITDRISVGGRSCSRLRSSVVSPFVSTLSSVPTDR